MLLNMSHDIKNNHEVSFKSVDETERQEVDMYGAEVSDGDRSRLRENYSEANELGNGFQSKVLVEGKAEKASHQCESEGENSGDHLKHVMSWYEETFSDELSGVRSASNQAHALRASLGGKSLDSSGIIREFSDVDTLNLSATSTAPDASFSNLWNKLAHEELSNIQTKRLMSGIAARNKVLEARMECIEEVEQLRMKLVAFETQNNEEIMEYDIVTSSDTLRSPLVARWDHDIDHSACWRCNHTFSFFLNRKHHCRRCGHIFCENCAPYNNVAPIPTLGYLSPVRQCRSCLRPESSRRNARDLDYDGKTGIMRNGSRSRQLKLAPAIDLTRCTENNCLRNPSTESVLSVLQTYVDAIEKIERAKYLDRKFVEEAHRVLERSMQAFVRMPEIETCLNQLEKAPSTDNIGNEV